MSLAVTLDDGSSTHKHCEGISKHHTRHVFIRVAATDRLNQELYSLLMFRPRTTRFGHSKGHVDLGESRLSTLWLKTNHSKLGRMHSCRECLEHLKNSVTQHVFSTRLSGRICWVASIILTNPTALVESTIICCIIVQPRWASVFLCPSLCCFCLLS